MVATSFLYRREMAVGCTTGSTFHRCGFCEAEVRQKWKSLSDSAGRDALFAALRPPSKGKCSSGTDCKSANPFVQIYNEGSASRQASWWNGPPRPSAIVASHNANRSAREHGFDYDNHTYQNQGYHRGGNWHRQRNGIKGIPCPTGPCKCRSIRSSGCRIRLGKEKGKEGDARCIHLIDIILHKEQISK